MTGCFQKISRMPGGWMVEIPQQYQTTDTPEKVWVPNEFFELSEADQAAEVKKIIRDIKAFHSGDKNFKKLWPQFDGWMVEVRHQHRTTDVPNIVWVEDAVFDIPEADQAAVIEGIKAFIYDPVDSGGGYMSAWHFLFKRNDFDVIPGEESEELLMRVIDRFGTFSLEWYCANVIGIIEKHTGWEDGIWKFPQPIPDPENKFSAGFRAGFLSSEGGWKHDLEIDAMRGAKSVESGKIGAEITHAATRAKTEPRLEKMNELIRSGKSQSNAARIAFNAGYGPSADANRKLWQRHRK